MLFEFNVRFHSFLKGLTKFYDQIIQAILRHVSFDSKYTHSRNPFDISFQMNPVMSKTWFLHMQRSAAWLISAFVFVT